MKKQPTIIQGHSKERGQSLVEMALGLIVIVILFSGLVDVGRAYYVYVALEDMAGEAALYLSINPPCLEESALCLDPNNADYRAEFANNSGLLDYTQVEFIVDPVNVLDRNEVSEDVTVIIRYPHSLITPILSQIAGPQGITLSASASQLIITEYVPIP